MDQEDLYIYLVASNQAVSAVLVREDNGVQKSIFYMSKILKRVETRYPNIEKVVLALLLAVKKFKVYLKNNQGIVITNLLFRRILYRPEMSGQMLALSVEMGPYCLKYRPRASMNAQVLGDFIAECSFSEEKGGGKPSSETKEGEGQEKEVSKDDHSYLQTLHVDGAAGTNQSRSGAILKGLDGLVISNARRFNFPIINNMAEYEALVNGM